MCGGLWLGEAVEAQGGVALLELSGAGKAAVTVGGSEVAAGGVFGDDEGFRVEAFGSGDAAEKAEDLGVGVFVFVGRIEEDEV